MTSCAICTGEIEPGGPIRWRGRAYHARCLVAAALLVGTPGSDERAEIALEVVGA